MSTSQIESNAFRRATSVCAVATAALGVLAWLGWLFGLPLLTSIRPDYIPIAPDTALLFVVLGLLLLVQSHHALQGRTRTALILVLTFASIYGLLKFVEYLLHLDLTFERVLFPITRTIGSFPVGRMSPASGLLFALAGIGLLLILYAPANQIMRNLAGVMGFLVLGAGFIATLGYLYGTPLLYGSDILPLAATTATSFLLFGTGLVAAAGPSSFIMRPLTGPSIRARMLRAFLPLIEVIVVVQGLVFQLVPDDVSINHALILAILNLIFIPITAVGVVQLARSISKEVERSEMERQRAERELRASEALYHSLVELLPESLCRKDREGRFTFANERFCQTVNRPLADIIGKTDFDLYPRELAEKYRRDDLAVMQSGQVFTTVEENQPSGGDRIYVQVAKSPLRDADGQVSGVQFIFSDISALKHAEEELAQAHRRQGEILESIQDGFMALDRDWRFRYVNQRAASNTGLAREKLIGQNLWELFPQIIGTPYEADTRRAMEERSPQCFEIGLMRDGPIYDIRIYPSADGISVFWIDITERKRAEQALLASERYARSIIDSSLDMIISTDNHQRIVEFNQAAQQTFGYTREEVLGQPISILYADPVEGQAIRQVAFDNGTVAGEIHNKRKNGEIFPTLLSASPLRDAGGRLLGVVGVSRDITELKRTQEELRNLSLTDELTGLYNRRGFMTLAEQQWRLARRNQRGFVILYLDMDDLKQINDGYGHAAGDQALVQAAELLKRTFRDSDILARVGGDEFLALGIDCCADCAESVLSRLNENLVAHNQMRTTDYPLSISVGVIAFDPNDSVALLELVARADRAMYENKRAKKRTSLQTPRG